jgi:hypothetical protein
MTAQFPSDLFPVTESPRKADGRRRGAKPQPGQVPDGILANRQAGAGKQKLVLFSCAGRQLIPTAAQTQHEGGVEWQKRPAVMRYRAAAG